MEVICLQDEALYALVEKVIQRIKVEHEVKEEQWITGDKAMSMLGIASKTTLQKLRDEDKIRFSQPEKKIILYDVNSINEYLDKHSNRK